MGSHGPGPLVDPAHGGSLSGSAAGWVRFALGAALGIAVRLLVFSVGLGHLPALDYGTVAAFPAGLLYGRAGALGAAAGALAALSFHGGQLPDPRSPLAALFVAWVAFEVFRLWPRVGRALPNLRSWLALLVAGFLGAGGSAVLKAWAMGATRMWAAIGAWWASGLTSILLLGPPLILGLLSIRSTAAACAPIPGEKPAGPLRWLRLDEGGGTRLHHVAAAVGPWVLAVGMCAVMGEPVPLSAGTYWIGLLFAVPVLWAANEYGLRGGVLVASFVGLCQLLRQPFQSEAVAASHQAWLSIQAGALIFVALGALWGGARQRESELNAQLTQANVRLRQGLKRTIRALQSAIAAKDAYTEGHLRRVSRYAVEVGERLGLTGKDLERLELASMLHDVGKIGIPEDILLKPGALDTNELSRMQDHPEIGARILEDVEGLAEVAPLVRYHQERWDGLREGPFPGYPSGRRQEDIPLGARIIAVVDAFDAMTSDRPYRPARPLREALAELRSESGRQFDPAVVDAFLSVLQRRPWAEDSRL